jgi:hypothetical protein
MTSEKSYTINIRIENVVSKRPKKLAEITSIIKMVVRGILEESDYSTILNYDECTVDLIEEASE